jgi:hypothetical protein
MTQTGNQKVMVVGQSPYRRSTVCGSEFVPSFNFGAVENCGYSQLATYQLGHPSRKLLFHPRFKFQQEGPSQL